MALKSDISWCDASWNLIEGCSDVDRGCANCYAKSIAARFGGKGLNYEGLGRMTDGVPEWTGVVRYHPKRLEIPSKLADPSLIFVNSTSDFFHPKVKRAWQREAVEEMCSVRRHIYIILTKRARHAQRILSADDFEVSCWACAGGGLTNPGNPCPECGSAGKLPWKELPYPNVWILVSINDQASADLRLPQLRRTPAALRGVSLEPMTGPVDLIPWTDFLDWVIVGGESGALSKVAMLELDWVTKVHDACLYGRRGYVPFFFKQLGTALAKRLDAHSPKGDIYLGDKCPHMEWDPAIPPEYWVQDYPRRPFDHTAVGR